MQRTMCFPPGSIAQRPLTDENDRVARQYRLDRSLRHDHDAKLRVGVEDVLFLLHGSLDELRQPEDGSSWSRIGGGLPLVSNCSTWK